MKDVVVLDKVRGIKIGIGDYIEYNPMTNSYMFEESNMDEGQGYNRWSAVTYEFSPEYIETLADRGLVEFVGDDKKQMTEGQRDELIMSASPVGDIMSSLVASQVELNTSIDKMFDDVRSRIVDIFFK